MKKDKIFFIQSRCPNYYGHYRDFYQCGIVTGILIMNLISIVSVRVICQKSNVTPHLLLGVINIKYFR